MVRFLRAKSFVPGLLLVALACGDDPVQPDLNPQQVTQQVTKVTAVLASPTMQDLVSLSSLFTLGAPPAASVATEALRLIYHSADVTAAGVENQREAVRALLAARPSFGVAGAAAVLPGEVLGVTFVYNPSTTQYEQSALTGAPSDGVRFILYAVDQLGQPVVPLVETGYVDLRDLSTSTSDVIRLTAVTSGTTFADYQVSASATETSTTIGVNGFIVGPDGTRVDVTFTATETASTANLSSVLAVTGEGFQVSTNLSFSISGESETVTVDITVQAAGASMQIAGTLVNDGGTLGVSVNGQPFATITLTTEGEPTIQPAGGGSLSNADLEAIGSVFGLGLVSVFFVLLLFVAPVGFLFGGI